MNIPLTFVLLFGISGGEIFIILLLVLLLFGPKKIPEIARTIGKGINEVKKVQRDINAEINRYADEIEKPAKQIESDIDTFKEKYYNPESELNTSGSPLADTQNVSNDASDPKAPDNLPYPYNNTTGDDGDSIENQDTRNDQLS